MFREQRRTALKGDDRTDDRERRQSDPSVVVVDDAAEMLTLIGWMLREEGHRVCTFTRAVDALEFVRAHPVSLVLSDFHMPAMDGIELATALRQSGWKGVFMFMSGHVSELKTRVSSNLQVCRIIEKPFDLVKLGETVETALNGS